MSVMKNQFLSAIAGILVLSASVSEASSWSPAPPRYPSSSYGHGHDSRRDNSLEARAQSRLRKLGYYRGPIDGRFGRGSRAALAHFQRHQGLRPTGSLDRWTVRALRL